MTAILVPVHEVPAPGPWARLARCRTAPTSLFFPTQGDDVDQAKDLCRGCPVLAECRDYALTYPRLHGVWGGLSERQREQMVGPLPLDPEEAGLLPCGTAAAYKRHLRHGEAPCLACTEANRLANRLRQVPA